MNFIAENEGGDAKPRKRHEGGRRGGTAARARSARRRLQRPEKAFPREPRLLFFLNLALARVYRYRCSILPNILYG
jgi:hypothetical protein